MKRLAIASVGILGVLALLAGCLSLGGGSRGPLDSFSFLPANNPGLTKEAVGTIVERGDPKSIEVVVPPGTDRSRLVATLGLGLEATITIISSGNRVIQENSLTPNDFSVPVIYALELPKQKKPVQYRVTVREAETNPLLAQISFPDGYVLQPSFSPSINRYSVEVPFATQSVRIQARGQSARLKSISFDGQAAGGAGGTQAVAFASGQTKEVTLTTVAEDGESQALYTILIKRGAPDRNSLLAALELPAASLNPAFSPAVLTYRAQVPFETQRVALIARPQSAVAKVTLLGPANTALPHGGDPAGKDGAAVDFPAGERLTVIVAVKAEDGSSRQYLLELNRAAPDSNNRLGALALDGVALAPAFSDRQLAYRGTVPYAAKQVKLSLAPQSKVAVVALEPGPQAPRTADGRLSYTGNPTAADGALIPFTGTDLLQLVVTVTAQNGAALRYTLELRRGAPDSNADLKSLAVSAGILSPAFTPKLISYSVSLPGSVEAIELTAAAASPVALVSVAERPELAPAPVLTIPVSVPAGGMTSLSVMVSAEDGTQRLYLVQVSRGAAPAGSSAAPPATTPTTAGPAATGPAQGSLAVAARNLRLEAREAAALAQRGGSIGGQGRLVVRYYRSQEDLLQAAVPVQARREGSTWAISFEQRWALDFDPGRLLEVEVSIPAGAGSYLYYTEALRSDGELSLEVPFLLYGSQPRVSWPAPGAAVAVGGYASLQPASRAQAELAAERGEFLKNDKGEYGITVELADAGSGRLLARETVWSRPGLARGHVFAFGRSLKLPEGSTVRYTLTATTRSGRVWRAAGTAQVWTTRLEYAGGFQPAVLLLADELAPQ